MTPRERQRHCTAVGVSLAITAAIIACIYTIRQHVSAPLASPVAVPSLAAVRLASGGGHFHLISHPLGNQWSPPMSRLRLSDLHDAGKSVDALHRFLGRTPEPQLPVLPEMVAPSIVPAELSDGEALALFTIRRSDVSLAVAARLRADGIQLQGPVFRNLRAAQYARLADSGFHELTPKGHALADTLAAQYARARNMHVFTYRSDKSHGYGVGRETVRCVCGWSASAPWRQSGTIHRYGTEHLREAVIADAPGIIPGGET